MAISCPSCKRVFSDESSYKAHLPCHGVTRGGREDLQKFSETEGGPDDAGL